MLLFASSLASKIFQQTVCLLAIVLIASAIPCANSAQVQSASPAPGQLVSAGSRVRGFSVQENAKIIVNNAKKITIEGWNNKEVALSAESANPQAINEEVNVEAKARKVEITCLSQTKTPLHLMVRVPFTASLELNVTGYKIEMQYPGGITRISVSDNLIEVTAPESAGFDFQEISGVQSITRDSGPPLTSLLSGPRRIRGGGRPLIKVRAKGAMVKLHIGNGSSAPSISAAARAIARTNGRMGTGLKKSHPELMESLGTQSEMSASEANKVEEEALKLETYLVNLNVSVMQKDGKALTGLTKDDFRIYEDGVLQDVTFFSPEKTPFNLVLLLDLSGSVRQKIDLIKETALHFLDVISPQDKVAVITFTTDVTVVSHLTGDRQQLRERIRNLHAPIGGTNFYDALGYTLAEELKSVRGQRNAVIVITDGQDNSLLPGSASLPRNALPPDVAERLRQAVAQAGGMQRGSYLAFEQLLDGVTEADALVYPVYLMQQEFMGRLLTYNSATGVNLVAPPRELLAKCERQLQSLADASGGKLFAAEKLEDLKGVYEQVAAELATVYSVAYNPKNTDYDGKFRRIQVKITKPEAAVRTRRGYYAQ